MLHFNFLKKKYYISLKIFLMLQDGQLSNFQHLRYDISYILHILIYFIQIPYKAFEFWKSHKNIEDLRKLEKQHQFPPRFRIQCNQRSTNSDMDLDVCFEVLKRYKEQDSEFVGKFSINKNVIGTKYICKCMYFYVAV